MYIPTSLGLSRMLDRANEPYLRVSSLIDQLGRRSFGLTFFAMGVVALIPGASTVIGVLLAWPAIQLLLGHEVPVLPRVIGQRKVGIDRLGRVIGIVQPRLERLERFVRPRWSELFQSSRQTVGVVMLLLGLTMISPVPFGHIIPAFVVMLLAVAYMEEDGLVLVIALAAAVGSLAITAATIWGTVATIDWLNPASPR